jgi:Putative adhesin
MSQYTFATGPSPGLEVRVSSGRLDIVESDDRSITVDVRGRGAENLVVEQNGDTVTIREDRNRFSDRSASLRVSVPRGTAVDITAASLDVYAKASLDRVNARTASGELDFEDIGSGELRSASGDVSFERCNGRCQISTASGDIRAEAIGGDAIITTASGDVRIELAESRVEAKSASGDISIACCSGNSVEAVSMSGDVVIGLPEGRIVEASIDSLSGEVRLPPRRTASTETGEVGKKETVKLRLKTVSGDIQVRLAERTS